MKKLFIALLLFAATLMTSMAQNAPRVPETLGMQPAKAVLVIEGTTGNNDKITEDCFVGLTQISQETWKFEFKNKNGETAVDLHLRDIVTKNDSTDVYMFDQGTLVWERVYDEAPLSQNIPAYSSGCGGTFEPEYKTDSFGRKYTEAHGPDGQTTIRIYCTSVQEAAASIFSGPQLPEPEYQYSMFKLTFQNNEPRSPFNKIQFLFRDR